MSGDATLSYAETERLVRVLHDVREPGEKALLARFKYFQRMDFPHRALVGRGSRVGYGFGEVLQLALAFQLMELGMSPVRIVRTLRTDWREVRSSLKSAWFFLARGGSEPPLLVMRPVALVELGRDEPVTREVVDPLLPTDRGVVEEWLRSPMGEVEIGTSREFADDDRSFIRVVIDPVRLIRTIRAVVPRISRLDLEQVDAAMGALTD